MKYLVDAARSFYSMVMDSANFTTYLLGFGQGPVYSVDGVGNMSGSGKSLVEIIPLDFFAKGGSSRRNRRFWSSR